MNENRNIMINGKEYLFIHNEKTANFEKDLFTVADILNKEDIAKEDRIKLLTIYRPAYHNSGKIEGITSYDSTATNCEFCQAMRKAAENNPLHICGYCYDYSQEHGFKGVNVLNRHSLNMIIMASVDFEIDELRILNSSYINRINSSGDVPNVTYACNMIKLAYAFSALRFAFWAKNTAAVITACDKYGKPENLVLVQSSPIIGSPAKLAKYFDFVFTVYLTKEDTEKAIADGSGECNGKKCKLCGYKCYYNSWNSKNVAEYLRIPGVKDEKRKEMLLK
jgi:hypothetical protein